MSDYVITEHTASLDADEPQAEDSIGIAYWPTDTHCARRVVRDGYAHNEGFVFQDGHRWRPFQVSYKAIIPKRCEAVNLLSPVCPSASHVGYGALRLEHQFHAFGQAAAIAADISLRSFQDVQDVLYSDMLPRMLESGMQLDVSQVDLPRSYGPAASVSRSLFSQSAYRLIALCDTADRDRPEHSLQPGPSHETALRMSAVTA